jgi:predicted amino acid racemase
MRHGRFISRSAWLDDGMGKRANADNRNVNTLQSSACSIASEAVVLVKSGLSAAVVCSFRESSFASGIRCEVE